MKSANWISTMGRSPARASPMPTPTIPDSARGVSSTRASPNSSYRPSVARNTPPRGPTSSPSTITRSSAAMRSRSVWRTVSTTLRSTPPSGTDMALGGPGRAAAADACVGGGVDVEGVVAVGDDAREPVGVGVLGDVLDGGLLGERHRDGVAVVLADEHHRQAVDPGQVQGLVEVALGRGPVAEVADRDAVLPPHLRRQGHAGGVGDVGGDRRRSRDDPPLAAAPVV